GPPSELVELLGCQVEVGDLTDRVHPDIRTPGDREPRRLDTGPTEQGRERLLEHPLHRAQPRLTRPACEVGAVVGEIEPDAGGGFRAGHEASLGWDALP